MKRILILLILISSFIYSSIIEDLNKAQKDALAAYKTDVNLSISTFEEAGIKRILKTKPKELKDSSYVSILNDYAFYLSENSRYKEALPILEKIIAINPERVVTYLNLGDCYLKNYKETENITLLKKAEKSYKTYLILLKDGAKVPDRVFDVILEEGEFYKKNNSLDKIETIESSLSKEEAENLKNLKLSSAEKKELGLLLKSYFDKVPKIDDCIKNKNGLVLQISDLGRIQQGIYFVDLNNSFLEPFQFGLVQNKKYLVNSANKKYMIILSSTLTGGIVYEYTNLYNLETFNTRELSNKNYNYEE